MNLITKIKQAKLVGRGGAGFPTALKWELTKKAKGRPKYVICNASEGEMGVFKDIYILENYPERVIKGMVLAMDYLGTKEAYLNINKNYYKKVKNKFNAILKIHQRKGYRFTIYQEEPSYIGGEEMTILNAIEGKRIQPRSKPPYPGDVGLFGKPTLINNVETFFNAAQVADGIYEPKRFYALSGKIKNPGVYHLPDDWNIQKVLEETENAPNFDFFTQIGGGASGLVINKKQASAQKMTGAGSLEVYPVTTKPRTLLLKWFKFYAEESCGKCTPCREGSYQLYQLVKNNKQIPWKKIMDNVELMQKTSFCALGQSIGIPVKSYLANVLHKPYR